jgi:integrase
MRRTHATLMRARGVDGKLVADQLGHSLDVNQNVYTQSSVENRLPAVNQLEKSLQACNRSTNGAQSGMGLRKS